MIKNRQYSINIVLLIIDLLSLFIALEIALFIRYGRSPGISGRWLLAYLMILYVALWVIFDINKGFFERGPFDELLAILKANLCMAVAITSILFLIHRSTAFSRLVFGYYFVGNTILQYILRLGFKTYMLKVYRNSKSANRMLLIISEGKAEQVLQSLEEHEEWFRKIVGIVLTDDDAERNSSYRGIPVVAGIDDCLDFCIQNPIDEIFVAETNKEVTDCIGGLITDLQMMGVIVNLNIEEFNLSTFGKKQLTHVGRYASVSFARNEFSLRQLFMKRILDIVGGVVGIVLFALAFVFIAPAIKLDSPGPIIFGQTRIGKNGRKFTFYKFRSMYTDAEERKKALMEQNEIQGLMFKMEDDPRITKVGKFLRETSLDELPQFINILKGDMSLVGTRPPTVDEYERYEAIHKCRLSMTPGLTGMWQVSGRSDIKDFTEVVRLDMQYIDNWSISKDIKILIQTVLVVLGKKGSR